MEITIENITPDIAKEYLRQNKKNRKVKPKTVESYARDIIRGNFITTHQGIGFDENGELFDGQHRLLAIVMANKSATMMVARGVPKEAISVVDRGVTRSIRDVIQIESSMDESIHNNILGNQKIISGLSQLVDCNYKRGQMRLNTEDIKKLYEEFSDSVSDVYYNVVTKAGASARAPMISAAIAAASYGVNMDAISKFFYIFFKDDITGCDNYNVHAALNWKRQIDNAKVNKVSMDRRRLYLGTQNAIYHFSNNTVVKRIVAPAEYRYDVEDKIKRALCIVE